MRLTKIKLAGFKSFVDPTTLLLPDQLTAIVGPNGCGKSNVIDAVRWVLGESSARSLRGESMADVIFNGSASRKPVGQAVIELVFDNNAGRLGGAWSQYSEIAVKRVVTRGGQSTYHLNGTRCRRRDVTDLFLGTGLGPRSYAIVEQGTISRIIEAKPEELRIFLEEAAGISRYKERRRETETRIRHTRDNLDRLNDLREELDRQLESLQRQARAAERYRRYRDEERRYKAELIALRWRDLDQARRVQDSAISAGEVALEGLIASQRHREASLETDREHRQQLTERVSSTQEHYFRVGAEINRREQAAAHRRVLAEQQQAEWQRLQDNLNQLDSQRQDDHRTLDETETALAEAEPQLRTLKEAVAAATAALTSADTAFQQLQAHWEALTAQEADALRGAEVARGQLELLEQQRHKVLRQRERLKLEQLELQKQADEGLDTLEAEAEEAEETLAARQEMAAQLADETAALEERLSAVETGLDSGRSQLQTDRGRLASLETLQTAALASPAALPEAIQQLPRLTDTLTVATGWEQAVETVLGSLLQARCVEQLAMVLDDTAPPPPSLALLETALVAPQPATLASQVDCAWPVASWLNSVRIAANPTEAQALRASLDNGESVICPQGLWLGRHWALTPGEQDQEASVLAREHTIRDLQQALTQQQTEVERLSTEQDSLRRERQERQQASQQAQAQVAAAFRRHGALQADLGTARSRVQQRQSRLGQIAVELDELQTEQRAAEQAGHEAAERREVALQALSDAQAARAALQQEREQGRQALETHRQQAAEIRDKAQRQALTVETLRQSLTTTRTTLERSAQQRQRLREREEELLAQTTSESSSPEDDDVPTALLEERTVAEATLQTARTELEALEARLREQESGRSQHEQQIVEQRTALEQARLQCNESRVRIQGLQDQLHELGLEMAAVLTTLSAEASEQAWLQRLEEVAERLQRLGAVNLAAIDELQQQQERKGYLDAQNQDLHEALATLEGAMRRIDRETRERLKDTFDRVNSDIQGLFPRLFGGGEAYLLLTGDDLLDAGVAIMARPPGKRIGRIQLLSGGEKALTAVALVFSLFQLNPAPFCMLDEVDAPLDEANVGRFGTLLQEMSSQVQFIVITHNKNTMEIARHLSGVTMHEPGVSRIVAVDVDAALQLAAV